MYALTKNHSIIKREIIATGDRLKKHKRYCFIYHGLETFCILSKPLSSATNLVDLHQNRFSKLQQGFNQIQQIQRLPCCFHLATARLYSSDPLKPSSRVEETVAALREKAKQESIAAASPPVKPKKKPWKQRVKDELMHYYHGFRLLFIDIKISTKLVWRLLTGYSLTRREHKLLVRTVGDLFRLVPFSVFIVVPFLEFTLPFFIKFFPGMLPSTFQTASQKDLKAEKSLKVKLEMAKFLQKTLGDMAPTSKGHSSLAKDFSQFFEKVRTSGGMTTSEEIMKFSKLFEDEITLDNLPRPQLMALCRILDMNPIGTTKYLRFQLRLKLRSLVADDMLIQKEGVNALSPSELQDACRARGMKAIAVSEERLKAQLSQWLDLSLNKRVPPSLLLLSQAFMFPDSTSTEEKLAVTIQALPDAVGTATKASICEREGKVDYKSKIEVIQEEVNMIKEERKEQEEEELKQKEMELIQKKETAMVDKAPTLMDKARRVDPVLRAVVDDIKKIAIRDKLINEDVTNKDMEALESALDTLGKDRNKLLIEKEGLQELREEMAKYQEDIADLQKLTSTSKEADMQETVAAKRLFRKVNKMISKMEAVLHNLDKAEAKDAQIKHEHKAVERQKEDPQCKSGEMLRIDDLIATIRKIEGVQESSLERLTEVLSKMDADRDGVVRVDALLKMLELVGNEKVKLNKKQVDELIDLIDKEEAIEMDEIIYKALKKDNSHPGLDDINAQHKAPVKTQLKLKQKL